jgi:hypothetical protein
MIPMAGENALAQVPDSTESISKRIGTFLKARQYDRTSELPELVSDLTLYATHVKGILDTAELTGERAPILITTADNLVNALANYQVKPTGEETANERIYHELMHEIRNPLSVCGGFAKRMLRGASGEEKMVLENVCSDVKSIDDLCMRFGLRHLAPAEFDLSRHLQKTYTEYTAQVTEPPELSIDETPHKVYHDPSTVAEIWRGIFSYIKAYDGTSPTTVSFAHEPSSEATFARIVSHFSCPFPVKHRLRSSTIECFKECGYDLLGGALYAVKYARGDLNVVPRGEGAEIEVKLPYEVMPRA